MKNETENMSGFTDETENTCVNWIRAALKVAVRYIDCVLNINQKTKSLIALHRRSFVALIRNKGSLILTVKTMQCFTFNLSISIVGC